MLIVTTKDQQNRPLTIHICLHKTDKSKTHTFTFGGNKKLELDRPNLFLAKKYENLRRD
jgi:hypothetical protein